MFIKEVKVGEPNPHMGIYVSLQDTGELCE